MIYLHIQVGEMMIRGDTYPLKDMLKHMGFKWASANKIWHRTCHEQDTIDYIIKMFEVNEVPFTADATVNFNMIDEEKMRSIRQAMLEAKMSVTKL